MNNLEEKLTKGMCYNLIESAIRVVDEYERLGHDDPYIRELARNARSLKDTGIKYTVNEITKELNLDQFKFLKRDIANGYVGEYGESYFSVRAERCLTKTGIKTFKDLVEKTESELQEIENFGRKSLNEVKEAVGYYDLSLGTKLPKKLELKDEKPKYYPLPL